MRFVTCVGACLVFAAGALFASVAAAETRACKITDARNAGNWIPLSGTFTFDREAGTAKAVYPTGDGDVEVEGKIATLNDKRVTLYFQAKGLRSNSGQYLPRMVYRPTIFFADNRLRVTAKPVGYSNMFSATGVCSDG